MNIEDVFKKYEKLIQFMAYKFSISGYVYGIEYDDLCQVGYLAIIEEIDKFDDAKSSLSNYIYIILWRAMVGYLNKNNTIVSIPKNMINYAISLSREEKRIYNVYNRKMTEEEKIEFLSKFKYIKPSKINFHKLLYTLEKINYYYFSDQACSIYESAKNINDDGFSNESIIDSISSEDNVEEKGINSVIVEIILDLLNEEKDRDKEIFLESIGWYDDFIKPVNYLAEKFGLTRSRIYAIQDEIKDNLRYKLKKKI